MDRYFLSAMNSGGPIAFATPLEIDDAISLAIALREDGYDQIVLTNCETGVKLANLEHLMCEWKIEG